MEENTIKKDPFYNHIEKWIMVFCLAMMCIITFVNVITRYFFSFTFSWAEQISRILFVWLTFSGISFCALKSGHLKVTVLGSVFHKAGGAISLFGDLVSILFGFYACYHITTIFVKNIISNQVFSAIPGLPVWVMYLPGVIFTFTFSLRLIQVSLIPAIKRKGGRKA